jgi:hypothetical protein
MMHFAVNTNAVPFSVTSNYQSDSIYNIRLREQQKNKLTPLNTRQLFQNRYFNTRSLNQTTWTIMTTLGMSTV